MSTTKLWPVWMMTVGFTLLVGCVPGLAPAATSTPTPTQPPTQSWTPTATQLPLPPTDTPAPTATPSPTPTATPQQAKGYEVAAWPAQDQPRFDDVQTVYARLTLDGEGVAGASMYVMAHYGKGDRRYPAEGYETTREDGIASVSFPVFDAGGEYPVSVDIYLSHGETTVQGGTSYTPKC